MKKMFTSWMNKASPVKGPSLSEGRNPAAPGRAGWRTLCLTIAIWILAGCAFTDMGQRVKAERDRVGELEKKRADLESRLIMVMNNLEQHSDDATLSKERDQVKAKLLLVEERLAGTRQMFDQILKEWEEKIVEERIQQQMIQKEVRDNARKDEYEWEDKKQGEN